MKTHGFATPSSTPIALSFGSAPSRVLAMLVLCAACLLQLMLSSPARATTYVAMNDGHLADDAQTIIVARVLSREVSAPGSPAFTDYQLAVERVVKGFVPGNQLILRVPGAVRAGGLSAKIWGAPELGEGNTALLFLNPRGDGTFQPAQLVLGTFLRVEMGGKTYAVRDLSELSEAPHPITGKLTGGDPRPRGFEAFISWLTAYDEGRQPEENYFVDLPSAELQSLHQRFTLIANPPIRWFEFDNGGSVSWFANQAGQGGLAGGGFAEFRRALNAWNADANTPIRHVYAGTTAASAGFSDPFGDGRNTIIFGDPNDEITGSFSCNRGGTIAIGGPRFDSAVLRPFDGRNFFVTLEAEVIMNDGAECYGSRPNGDRTYEEVYGHELGHTLGLGHSCGFADNLPSCFQQPVLDDALMRATVHDDGRGARLNSDDLGGARTLYRQRGGTGGGRPAAPTAVEAELAGLDALLSWQDNSTNEDGFRIYRRQGTGAFLLIAEVSADSTGYTDPDLAPNSTFGYQIAAFNAQGERRSGTVTVDTPELEPVAILSLNLPVNVMTGEAVSFEVEFSGPATRAEWTFGDEGRGYNLEPCAADRFCQTHLFAAAGSYTITVELIGDLGQRSSASGSLNVIGDVVSFVSDEGIIQSTIFGPRGDTGTFESNCWTHNASSETLRVVYTYLPRGAGNPDPEQRNLTLAPGTSVFLPNILESLFAESNTQGSVSVSYDTPVGAGVNAGADASTICRSFVILPGSESSFGQFVGENREDTWTAAPKVVTGIFQNDDFESTVLAVNVDNTSGGVEVTLIDAVGAQVGSPVTLPLGPRTMRFRPLSQIFPEATTRPGPFTARFASSGIRFLASATLLETGSEDQIFINAREPEDSNPLFIPRVARAASQFDAFLISQLIARNDSSQPTELTLELWLRGQANLDPATAERTVPAGGILVVDDVIGDLFGLDGVVGTLRILWSNAEGVAPRVQTYSFNGGQGGGAGPTFGMLVDSRSAADAAAETAVAFGAEQSEIFRADFGIVNLATTGTSVRVTLSRETGEVVATTVLGLQPRQHLERNMAGIFRDTAIGLGENWSVRTEVLSGGPVLTYVANINASGDIFFVPGEARTTP